MLKAHLNQKIAQLIPTDEPFAIAFSGGGDSTALVHALKDHPQAKQVYIVDHDLRKGSGAEAHTAKDFAIAYGFDAIILLWAHNSPETAIQEKARCARYGLMGQACRHAGIQYLLTAHSEDDQAETLLMRYERRTDWRGAAAMAEVSHGPVWPQLAGVNIVRPLLSVTRQVLRDYNRAHSLNWAEDPSNDNRDYARIRARDYLKSHETLRQSLLATAREMRGYLNDEKAMLRQQFASIGQIDENGIITFSKLPVPELLFHALRCAGGQGGTIDRMRLKKLLRQMRGDHFKSATLGGALVARHKSGFVICRDPVAVKGRQDGHHKRQAIRHELGFRLSDMPQIWDGRFIVTGSDDQSIGAVHHEAQSLTKKQRQNLKTILAPARATLPVFKEGKLIQSIGEAKSGAIHVESLVKMRLEAALGGRLA